MLGSASARLLVSSLALLACACVGSGDRSSTSEPSTTKTEPDPLVIEGEPAPTPESPGAELPDCPAEAATRTVFENLCTPTGKLAGQWRAVDTLGIPADAEVIFEWAGPTSPRPSLTIALRGDELWIGHVSCGDCRRVLGEGFAGHIGQLSKDQMLAVQERLGLGQDVGVLSSPEAWRSFVASDSGRALLEAIARDPER